jgi:adenosylcobinamide-GDP ribazoletransferase
MRAALRGARLAVTFLTRLPVGGFPYQEDEARWASAWFPAIGAVLGVAYAAVFAAMRGAGAWVAAALVVASALLVTGAFHEDGLADSADALGGAVPRERVFEILKDSRIGSYGAAALIVAVLLRVALLVRLADGPLSLLWVLAISESLSRAAAVGLMVALPYATSDAYSKSRRMMRAGPAQAALASAWPLAVLAAAACCGGLPLRDAAVVVAAVAAFTTWLGWRFVRRVGGVTGDFLGATQQVTAVVAQLTLALLAPVAGGFA